MGEADECCCECPLAGENGGLRVWNLRKASLISLLFLLVEVSSGSEERSVKWRSNWTQISRTQGPDLSSPLHVAQCRATCLQKVITTVRGLLNDLFFKTCARCQAANIYSFTSDSTF